MVTFTDEISGAPSRTPSAWSLFSFTAQDHCFVPTDSPGHFPEHRTPPTVEVLRKEGKIAPISDPYRYYGDQEVLVAEWLKSRGIKTRSVATYKTPGRRSPDALAVTDDGTIEFKLTATNNFLTNVQQILYRSTQSPRVLLFHSGEMSKEEAEMVLGTVIKQSGKDIDAVMIYLSKEDRCVYWQR